MRIVFYIKPLATENSRRNDRDVFVYESLFRLMSSRPEHTYFLVEDGPGGPANPFPSIARYTLQSKGVLGNYRKYRWKFPALLKKLDASVVLSLADGVPLKGEVPSCLVVANGASLDPEQERFIRMADTLAALSGPEIAALVSRNLARTEDVLYIPPSIQAHFGSLGWEAREQVKEMYSNGREYFIHLDPLADEAAVIQLLKGFSILKKRLRSSMALVLAGERRISESKITGLLATYHFRGDIVRLEDLDLARRAQLVGGAYALVTASADSGFRSPLLEALQSQVPVLAASKEALRETAGEAALYFKEGDFADLGERFCDIYKYENLRARLIEKADGRAALYQWDKTADALWCSIVKAAEAKK